MTDPTTVVEARLRADALLAGTTEALPGGATRLRTPGFPFSYDLNAVWAPPGADQDAVDALTAVAGQRVWLPDPAPGIRAPEGWVAEDERLLARSTVDAPSAARPAGVERVPAARLQAARQAVWETLEPQHAADLAAMQAQLGEHPEVTTLAVLHGDEPVAWCTVQAGAVDDVWTQPAHRRRGLARAIVRGAMATGGWFLGVDPGNASAIALYESEGFADVGRLVGLLRG